MKTTFETLNVRQEVVRALKEQGIVEPTTIQEKTIPLFHEGKDIIGISRTGSGKTASFGIPLIEKVQAGKGVQGLILAPTRELANQISNEIRKWSKYLNLNIATIFGGVAMPPQEKAMRNSEIIVATPGRLLDHLRRGSLNLSKLNSFVLDEADKMVEMGFIEDIEQILKAAPAEKQIILFGATISNEVDYLKKKYMDDVVIAEAELQVKKDLLEQYYYDVRMNEKFSLLIHLLNKEEVSRAIIFCSKRSTVELIHNNLREQKIKTEKIHGNMSQNKRLDAIDKFNKGKVNYLVASSVAARGLDIKEVSHVINYDLSKDPQEYVHRVGRTARAGESGVAITLLAHQDHGSFYGVLDRYRMEVQELPRETFPQVTFNTQLQKSDDQRDNGGRNNFRGGQRNSFSSSGRRSDFGPSSRGNFRRSNRSDDDSSNSSSSKGNYGRNRSNFKRNDFSPRRSY